MPKYGCKDKKYWAKSLPHRIIFSLHYIDEWYTTDEGVHYNLTSYFYRALTTERTSARFESPSHISLQTLDMRQLFQAYYLWIHLGQKDRVMPTPSQFGSVRVGKVGCRVVRVCISAQHWGTVCRQQNRRWVFHEDARWHTWLLSTLHLQILCFLCV